MPRGEAYLWPFQVANQREYGDDRLLRYLPRWLQGPLSHVIAGAFGRQLDAIDGLGIDDQLFVTTATWGLAFDQRQADGTVIPSGWERDYGIGVKLNDSLATRRLRVLGRIRGGALRTLYDFAAYTGALLGVPLYGAAFGPSIGGMVTYSTYGRWVVFKPPRSGFPGNFLDVEAALALAGPAHIGLWLAPHRESPDSGLTDDQLNLIHGEAIDVLLDSEIDAL